MTMDQREANLFIHLINHLYERSSICTGEKIKAEQKKAFGMKILSAFPL